MSEIPGVQSAGSAVPRSGASPGASAALRITPITLREANEFISIHHRHHVPTPTGTGGFFAIAVSTGDDVRGVAVVGAPAARMAIDGYTVEVRRVATDGTKNACSMLYAACWRAAKAMGYRRLITYTLPSEGGASLRAAGWKLIGQAGGGSWDRPGRPRVDKHPTLPKFRWEAA